MDQAQHHDRDNAVTSQQPAPSLCLSSGVAQSSGPAQYDICGVEPSDSCSKDESQTKEQWKNTDRLFDDGSTNCNKLPLAKKAGSLSFSVASILGEEPINNKMGPRLGAGSLESEQPSEIIESACPVSAGGKLQDCKNDAPYSNYEFQEGISTAITVKSPHLASLDAPTFSIQDLPSNSARDDRAPVAIDVVSGGIDKAELSISDHEKATVASNVFEAADQIKKSSDGNNLPCSIQKRDTDRNDTSSIISSEQESSGPSSSPGGEQGQSLSHTDSNSGHNQEQEPGPLTLSSVPGQTSSTSHDTVEQSLTDTQIPPQSLPFSTISDSNQMQPQVLSGSVISLTACHEKEHDLKDMNQAQPLSLASTPSSECQNICSDKELCLVDGTVSHGAPQNPGSILNNIHDKGSQDLNQVSTMNLIPLSTESASELTKAMGLSCNSGESPQSVPENLLMSSDAGTAHVPSSASVSSPETVQVGDALPPSTSDKAADSGFTGDSVSLLCSPAMGSDSGVSVSNGESTTRMTNAQAPDFLAVPIKSEPLDTGYEIATSSKTQRPHRTDIAKTANRHGTTTTVIQRGKKKVRVTVVRGEWRTPKPTAVRAIESIRTPVRTAGSGNMSSRVTRNVPLRAGRLASLIKTEPGLEEPAASKTVSVTAVTTALKPVATASTSSAIPTALFRNAHIKTEPADFSYSDGELGTRGQEERLSAAPYASRGARGQGRRGRGRGRGLGRLLGGTPRPKPRSEPIDRTAPKHERPKMRACTVQLKLLPFDVITAGRVNLKTNPQVTKPLNNQAVKVSVPVPGNRPCSSKLKLKVLNPEAYQVLKRRDLSGPRPWPCEVCDKTFKTQSGRGQHRKVHIGIKEHTCQFCGKAYMYKSTLTAHYRSHTNERPYVCNLCGAGFRWSNHLTNHLATHNAVKKFKCEQCGKSFAQQANLYTHLKIHLGLRPHSCSVCNATFSSKNYIKVHMRTHTGEKPFQCNLCPAAFAHANTLVYHISSHNDERPYQCRLCSATFRQSAHRRTHVKLMHEKPEREGYKPRKQRRPVNLGPKSIAQGKKNALLTAKIEANVEEEQPSLEQKSEGFTAKAGSSLKLKIQFGPKKASLNSKSKSTAKCDADNQSSKIEKVPRKGAKHKQGEKMKRIWTAQFRESVSSVDGLEEEVMLKKVKKSKKSKEAHSKNQKCPGHKYEGVNFFCNSGK